MGDFFESKTGCSTWQMDFFWIRHDGAHCGGDGERGKRVFIIYLVERKNFFSRGFLSVTELGIRDLTSARQRPQIVHTSPQVLCNMGFLRVAVHKAIGFF